MSVKYNYKTLSFEQMADYIETNVPQDKAWFKQIAIGKRAVKDKEGNVIKTIEAYSHLKAKRAFAERYMPEILPVAKPKAEKVTSRLENW